MRRIGLRGNWCWMGFVMVLSTLLCLCAAAAEEPKVDFSALTHEVQRTRSEKGAMTMLFWYPPEYWEISMARNGRTTKEQQKALVNAIRPYTVIAVIDGRIGTFGEVTYAPEAETRANIQLVDAKGNVYEPLGEDDIQDATKNLLAIFKPVISNMLGPMGKNMHIMVFPAKDKNSKRLADPKSKGAFVVKLNKEEFRWKLPLGSLLPEKQCPKCHEKCSGAWDFCPWCGSKLPKTVAKKAAPSE